MAASHTVEEVQLVKLAGLLQAFLSNVVVTERSSCLGESDEVLVLLKFLSGLKSDLNIATGESQVESFLGVLLKEEGDFTVALLLQISDQRSATELAFAKDFLNFLQVFAVKCLLE